MDKLNDLKLKKDAIEDKIRHLELDLKKPLSTDIEEHAVEETDRRLLMSLYAIEKKNLARINQEIKTAD